MLEKSGFVIRQPVASIYPFYIQVGAIKLRSLLGLLLFDVELIDFYTQKLVNMIHRRRNSSVCLRKKKFTKISVISFCLSNQHETFGIRDMENMQGKRRC
jgi:hypothetical protein